MALVDQLHDGATHTYNIIVRVGRKYHHIFAY